MGKQGELLCFILLTKISPCLNSAVRVYSNITEAESVQVCGIIALKNSQSAKYWMNS